MVDADQIRCRHMHAEEAMEAKGSNRDKTVSTMEGQLERWGAKLDELVAKGTAAGREAKTEARAHVEELKSKLRTARSKLDAAKAAGSDKWDAFKEGLESSWKELEATFKQIAPRSGRSD